MKFFVTLVFSLIFLGLNSNSSAQTYEVISDNLYPNSFGHAYGVLEARNGNIFITKDNREKNRYEFTLIDGKDIIWTKHKAAAGKRYHNEICSDIIETSDGFLFKSRDNKRIGKKNSVTIYSISRNGKITTTKTDEDCDPYKTNLRDYKFNVESLEESIQSFKMGVGVTNKNVFSDSILLEEKYLDTYPQLLKKNIFYGSEIPTFDFTSETNGWLIGWPHAIGLLQIRNIDKDLKTVFRRVIEVECGIEHLNAVKDSQRNSLVMVITGENCELVIEVSNEGEVSEIFKSGTPSGNVTYQRFLAKGLDGNYIIYNSVDTTSDYNFYADSHQIRVIRKKQDMSVGRVLSIE